MPTVADVERGGPAQPEGVERKLAAILAADVVGYSRLMARDEAGTHARLKALRRDFIEPAIAGHHGRIVKLMGDGALVEFASVVDAVQCAALIQRGMAERNAGVAPGQRIEFRIGVNLGDVIIEGDDIYGDGVNIAARLEGLAEPGGIVISGTAFDHAKNKAEVGFGFLGRQPVKNIPEPVRAYQVLLDPAAVGMVIGDEAVAAPARRRWPAIAAAITLLLAGGGLLGWLQPWEQPLGPGETHAPPDKPSIAVLPFDNLSGDPEEEYFTNGLTDDLITDLSKISGLLVIARNSVFAYEGEAVDVRQVAAELGVRYVLEGSVRRAGGRVRINAQLIDARTGGHLWAERYDREHADIFAVQDEVIERIVEALSVRLTETERTQVARLPTASLEAYDYYLRGEELAYRVDPASAAEALSLYEKAMALDPEFADPYAGYARVAADVLAYNFADALPSAVARKRAYEAAGRALVLNPQLSRGYSVLALLQMLDSEHEEAIASARQAVDLAPNSAEAHLNLAVVQTYAGRHDEALRTMDTVLRLNPKPPDHVYEYQALVLYMNRRYAEAIATLEMAQDAPRSELALETLAAANARLGRMDEAKSALEGLFERWPDESLAWYRVMYAHHAREEDLAHRLEGLRLAGLPDWPYGFESDPEYQLRGEAIDTVTFGRTWIGELASIAIQPFMQYVNSDGAFIQRGPNNQLVGTAWRSGDLLCLQSPSFLLGRRSCGPIYRNPSGAAESEDQYTFVSASGVKRFATRP